MEEFRIDLNLIFKSKLKLDEWFILYCLNENREDLLIEYINSSGLIPTETFIKLRDKNFLLLSDITDINFGNISLTNEGQSIFKQKLVNIKEQIEPLFNEIKKIYPSKIGHRRLHGNNQKCIQTYFKTLVKGAFIDLELHEKIKKCIVICVNEHRKVGKLEFMKNLETFLNQRTWESYLEDIDKQTIVRTNFDSI